ncbi:MAG TPA: tetratricopeptide repeat protein [Steroidobacteraceae bacterium]|nr:tetratricopeptide repeat protein [Steroidobacteraceae bacterium]
MPLRLARALCLGAVLALLAGPAFARRHDPEKLPEIRVRDLHYGDALFYYYQHEDFEALTRLAAYEQWNRMPHHEEDAQLLMGGLYLALGMHNEAGQRFEALLKDPVPSGVRNVAWFYLAQVWYARGYLDRAALALARINGRMSPERESQKELLLGNVLIHQGKNDEAIRLLSAWRGTDKWSAYARFNLGVALVRGNRLADADPFLTGVGTMLASTEEQLALKDRANLALGFAYLQGQQPAKALPALDRVRLNGPYSNKALLGTGWAEAALGDYQGALGPWMELRKRSVMDAAVQESLLAVPYAFGKLNANAQSAEYYESAVESFQAENGRLDAAIARIEQGDMLKSVLQSGSKGADSYGWFWQLKNLPDAPESRYLYTVLAGNDFQEGLKNYRDLAHMSDLLQRGGYDMEAYEDMIETRERAYGQRLASVDTLLASDAVARLQQRDVDLAGRLQTIEARHDVAALGTESERDQWTRVQRIEGGLAGAPDDPENNDLRERLALVRGVLLFRLNDAYSARLWEQHRSLKDLSLALHEAQSRWIRVEQARRAAPTNTGEFATRIAALKTRIDALESRLAATEQRQADYLARVAVDELDDQKTRLAAYEVQARFALGGMYDRAANAEAAPVKAPAAQQKGAEEEPSGEGAAPEPLPPAGEAPPEPPPEAPPAEASPAEASPAAAPPTEPPPPRTPAEAPRAQAPPPSAPESPR